MANPITVRRWTCDICGAETETTGATCDQPESWIGVLIASPPLRSQGDIERTLHCPGLCLAY